MRDIEYTMLLQNGCNILRHGCLYRLKTWMFWAIYKTKFSKKCTTSKFYVKAKEP